MSNIAVQIIPAIKTALEGVAGLDADHVIRGYPTESYTPPCAWVAMDQLSGEHGPDLPGGPDTMTVSVWASPVSDGSTHAIREDACINLMGLLVAAIQSSATLLALLSSPPITAAKADVQGAGGPGTPMIVIVVECRYLLDYGSGI